MTRRKVVIDTDPGVDDAAALLMALGAPEFEVLGVTVVAGNVPLDAALTNARRIVALARRPDVPILAGAPGPLLRDQVFGRYAEIGAFDPKLVGTGGVAPAREHAVDFLVRQTRAAAEADAPLTICAIGPLTNIALALTRHPDVARGIERVVCMGGAFSIPGHRTQWAEFNLYADPHAAEIVFASGVPLTIAPLDVTTQALFDADHIARFAETGGEAGRALASLLAAHDRSDPERHGRPGGPLHDAATVAWLLEPELFSGRRAAVGVDASGDRAGRCWADFEGVSGRVPSATVLTRLDEAGFIELVTRRIAAHGKGER